MTDDGRGSPLYRVPPDDDDALPDPAPGPYASRHRLVLVRDVPEPVAASLAGLVPGIPGVILYCASRGDAMADVVELLHLDLAEIDAILADQAGHHLVRPLG